MSTARHIRGYRRERLGASPRFLMGALLVAFAGFTAGFTGGCTLQPAEGTEDPGADDAQVSTDAFGVVRIRARNVRTSETNDPGIDVDAHFFRAASLSRIEVLRGLGVWNPAYEDEGCVVVQAPRGVTDRAARVRLMDAGSLEVLGNGESLRMDPRAIPSYIPQFSGFAYGTESPTPPVYAAGELYVVDVLGGSELEAFSVPIVAPPPTMLAMINETALGSASRVPIATTEDLVVDLISDGAPVTLVVRRTGSVEGPSVQCRFETAARVRFGASELDDALGNGDLEVTVRSETRQPFPSEAEMDGVVIFEFSDRVGVVRD
jgi:hypothetical protein